MANSKSLIAYYSSRGNNYVGNENPTKTGTDLFFTNDQASEARHTELYIITLIH